MWLFMNLAVWFERSPGFRCLSTMCFCWTHAVTSGPVWLVGCAVYKEFWDASASSKSGFVTVRNCIDGSISKIDSDLIGENPFQRAVDIFPYPPPVACDWHRWRFLHRLCFDRRMCCRGVAMSWYEMSSSSDRAVVDDMAAAPGTCRDKAVLFCWLHGFNLMKKSDMELVHYHIDLTVRDLRRLRELLREGNFDGDVLRLSAEFVLARGWSVFGLELARLRDRSICGNCAKVRTCRTDTFSSCSGCHRVRYCSLRCQSQHWENLHKYECKKLGSASVMSEDARVVCPILHVR